MSALASLRDTLTGVKPPKDVTDRITRGRDRMRELAPRRNLSIQFWRGEQFAYVNRDNLLQSLATSLDTRVKPAHRMRTVHDLLVDAVEHEVAMATQRVPAYQVVPSKIDPGTVDAAKMAEKVARYGYDAWQVAVARERVVTYSVVTGEGFAWPYFDPDLNWPLGDICVRVFGPNEVVWEPGERFEDSRWHAVIQARPVETIKAMDGYLGGDLKADADTSTDQIGGQRQASKANMVLVTDYLERPSAKLPQGRRLTIANDRLILAPENYPCEDGEGQTVDEPVLHYLPRIIDPSSDRAMGLVEHAIPPQRTYNDCWNKQLEWKNHALLPQILAPKGSIRDRLTDEPGKVITFIPVGGVVPQWRPVPPIPPELEQMKQAARAEIQQIFAQNDIPSQVSAARAIQAILDRDENRRAGFTKRMAEWDSRMMRHCIYLVQHYYNEPRLLKIRGQWGPENIQGFEGADLRGQADIQVLPTSIEPRTKESIQQTLMNLAQVFPGFFDPNKVLEAVQNGTAESIIESYELDVSRVNRMIQRIQGGPAMLFQGEAMNPAAVNPQDPATWPRWMPRPFDNIAVQKAHFEDFLKTSEYDSLDPAMQEAALLIYQGFETIEAQKQAQAAAAQAAQAQDMGAMNATKGPGAKPLPSLPALPQSS